MKGYGGSGAWLHSFLTSALDWDEWSASRRGRFNPRERAAGAHWTGLSTSLDCVGKIKSLTLSGIPGQPAHNPVSKPVLSNIFIYWGAADWWLWRRGRRVAIEIIIVILIKIITDFIFMIVFPEIFWSSHEISFICKQESAREGELSEDRFIIPPK
jgi:hypothetical protein